MSVSRIAQRVSSDVVDPAVLSQIVKLSGRIHLTSAICTHWANVERRSSPAAGQGLSPQDGELCVKTGVKQMSP
jgi:hypothetical protein